MRILHEMLKMTPEYRAVSASCEKGALPGCVTGLAGVHKANLIAALSSQFRRNALVLAADEAEAQRMSADLLQMGRRPVVYPYRELVFRNMESHSREYERQRLSVLSAVQAGEADTIVCCIDAALQVTIPPEELRKRTAVVKTGAAQSPESLVQALVSAGYERAGQVEGEGQFARRGGIVDFFAPGMKAPVRVEFWGDEIDSASYFDPDTQRRTEPAEELRLSPSVEAVVDDVEALLTRIAALTRNLRGRAAEKAKSILLSEAAQLKETGTLGCVDKYLPILYDRTATLLDYVEEDWMVFVSEETKVKERARTTVWQSGEDLKSLMAEGTLCRGLDRYTAQWVDALLLFEQRDTLYLESFPHGGYETPVRSLHSFQARQLSVWSGGVAVLKEELDTALNKKWACVVMAGTEKAAIRLAEDLREQGMPVRYENDPAGALPGMAIITAGGLSAGLEYPGAKVLLVTHGIQTQVKTRKRKAAKGREIQSLSELSVGDYVVHSVHGIGQFEGIHKMVLQGVTKDYIKIRYAKQDVLYVPVTQLDLVSKYIGTGEDTVVKMHTLGGTEWQKAKTRVRAAVKDIAKELIQLYAKRMQAKGHAFPEDTDWQKDFEAHFEYTETDDQLRCISEIKADMQRTAPMDRLLCGDVGFGKTEVALRAAFKCISDSKQCALLVPTTILAWQHYQTVLRRMEQYPIRVGLLSRFRTARQQDETIRQLRAGELDMVVGTHRMVQKDIGFRDLGLVIIDEEQRFGVAQKEKLKTLCENVDVLTLSATPIPRTLNMAMSGIRDMSVIEEAPMDRQPVQTYVLEHDHGVIEDAIRRELRRGGQVYYLHNRVESIEGVAARLQRYIPEARIAVAHGKMSEEELSEVWSKLIEQEVDVLVCTTIIETGVDVPNANTLVIENADRMGLSQLHQLRGRVGRSSRRAYAYFTYPAGKVLSEISTKRLTAIREFTEFGSGFRIAMRDLELRGAGNVLGAQQHGHMEAVGYDLYLKLLNEAIAVAKGEKPEIPDEECLIDVQVQAHIPERYIEDLNQRLDMYRRIADIRSEQDGDDVVDEMIDRFGDPPTCVTGLVDVALLRNRASALGIREVRQTAGKVLLYVNKIDKNAVGRLVSKMKGRVLVSAGAKPYITVFLQKEKTVLKELQDILSVMASS